MFICLEGIDGSGKTSTAAALRGRLAAGGREPVLIRKASVHVDHPDASRRFAAIGRATWRPGLDNEVRGLGYLTWILYNAAYYAALADALVRPALAQCRTVIIDGWYYKFVLRAAALGSLPVRRILPLFGEILVPDAVFLLDVPPAVAAARLLGGFTDNETGNGTRAGLTGTGAFVAFQNDVRTQLLDMADAGGWTVVAADGDQPGTLAGRIARAPAIHHEPGGKEW